MPPVLIIRRAGSFARNHGCAERTGGRTARAESRAVHRLGQALQNLRGNALGRLLHAPGLDAEHFLRVERGIFRTQPIAGSRNLADAAPLTAAHFENFEHAGLRGQIAGASHTSHVLVLHFGPPFFELRHAVFERFKELSAGKTTVIISHRFPTVRMADRILVLEHGSIIEDGNHADLVAAHKTYARLYEMQAKGYL